MTVSSSRSSVAESGKVSQKVRLPWTYSQGYCSTLSKIKSSLVQATYKARRRCTPKTCLALSFRSPSPMRHWGHSFSWGPGQLPYCWLGQDKSSFRRGRSSAQHIPALWRLCACTTSTVAHRSWAGCLGFDSTQICRFSWGPPIDRRPSATDRSLQRRLCCVYWPCMCKE